jgi:CheY-like chemotaxis protein
MTTKKWILLVEDNANDADLVMRALKTNQPATSITVATDGLAAMDCLHRRGAFESRGNVLPSMVLLDLKMPRVGGLEVLAQIKADDRLKCIPVVVFTSSREEQDIRRSYQLGANAYVVKPVEFRQYVATVQGLHAFWMSVNEPPPAHPGKDDAARSVVANSAAAAAAAA